MYIHCITSFHPSRVKSTVYIRKMKIKKLNKEWKKELTDVSLAFGVLLIALFAFKYFNPSIENMLVGIIFMITYFGLKNIK